jgi:spermidine synthase
VRRFPLLALFFASGCAALIYELVWFHLVQLVVGASSFSVAAILASFMGGMALGSALLPRLVSPTRHPLRVLAAIEGGLALFGAAMPLALPLVREAYVAMAGYGLTGAITRAVVCALVLLPPTILMGATLPIVARWTGGGRQGSAAVGLLYMANIAGGATGTVLAGFYLLRVFDTYVASGAAVALNVAGAAIALALARTPSPAPDFPPSLETSAGRQSLGDGGRLSTSAAAGRFGGTSPEPAPSDPASEAGPSPDATSETPDRLPTPDSRLPSTSAIYVVAALSGLTALGAEVIWTRQLSLLFGASVYTFSLILAVFLTGLGLGSLLGSAVVRRSLSPALALGASQLLLALAIGFGAWTIVVVLPVWQPTQTFLPHVWTTPALHFAYDALRSAVAMLPATLLWGASFPLAIAAAAEQRPPGPVEAPEGTQAARVVARINAVNTAGALTGAIAFTILGVPYLGSQHAQQTLALLAAAAAAGLLGRVRGPARLAIGTAVVVASAGALWLVPPVPNALIAYGRSVASWSTIARYFYVAEGATASVAVTENTSGARQFHIAGKVEASDMDIDMRLERMLGHVPALVHPNPRSILIVGVGAGVTAGALIVHPEVERIVVCEIEPVVPASARTYFAEQNHHVFDDPRVELVYDDARHFLQTTREKFDIITSDPIHPWVRGAATLYSLEYLQLVRDHLNPGGVVTEWVPLYETDARSVKSELATFVQVFSDTTLWNPDLLEEGYDLVALGRVDEAPIVEASIDARLRASPVLEESLAQVSLGSGATILATYAGRGRDLAPWLADAEINRERHLRLQYLAGLGALGDQRYAIFQAIVRYRRYPADLFVASAGTEMRLRQWYEPDP